MTSVSIGNFVTSIGDYAFRNCTALNSLTIGANVVTIGDYAFYYCPNLTAIEIPDEVTSVDSNGSLTHHIIAGSDGTTPPIITGIGSESDPYQLANYKEEDPEPSGTSNVDPVYSIKRR